MNPFTSFLRWRKAKPRPTLRQWIRGYRGSLYIEGRHVGFTKNFEVHPSNSKATGGTIDEQKVNISMTIDELEHIDPEVLRQMVEGIKKPS
jgi:hypothetical protein